LRKGDLAARVGSKANSDEIGRLAQSFDRMAESLQAGYDILKEIQYPWPIANVVLQHHERLDGSGYPQGLAGEQVLLGSRIIAVADVLEAMASHRPYRPALEMDVALAEIERGRGTAFDPAVVDACLTLFRERRFAFQG
jgi:HD-GYP domain-containing protein (c-di-GMP phosphodiesterase class II)